MTSLLESIKSQILAKIPEIKTCLIYPSAREEIIAPAVFLEISGYKTGSDPATGELSLIASTAGDTNAWIPVTSGE